MEVLTSKSEESLNFSSSVFYYFQAFSWLLYYVGLSPYKASVENGQRSIELRTNRFQKVYWILVDLRSLRNFLNANNILVSLPNFSPGSTTPSNLSVAG